MKLRGVLLALALWGRLAAQGTFSEWTIPTPNSQPHCVVSDSRGRIWYAAIGANQVGVYDPATDQFRELRPPTSNSGPHGIAVGPGDTIWFTEQRGNRIGRVNPDTFEITEYPLANAGSSPHTPIWDGRNSIWFTEQNGNRIGRLDVTSGQIEEFTIPTANSGPYGIITDREGNAWFCSFGAGSNRIGRVDARTGQITEYSTPTANSGPRRPWIDSRGRIWITLNRVNKIAVFDPATERFREFDSPGRNGQPYGIVVDRNDQVWYNEFGANNMVRFDPISERFTVFPFPGANAQVRIVAVDAQDRVWYGNNGSSRIGLLQPVGTVVSAASFQGPPGVAPGAIVALFGMNLARATRSAQALPLPSSLEDTTVRFNDTPAPLFFVSGSQINAQAPFELSGETARVEVRRASALIMTQTVPVVASAPGIFTVNQQGSGAGIIVHAQDFRLVTESAPAQAGEFIAIFLSGLGRLEPAVASGAAAPSPPARTPAQPQVTIAGRPATVSFSGAAPGFVGLNQINVQVPAGTPAGAQPLQVSIDGRSSNTVTLAVGPPGLE